MSDIKIKVGASADTSLSTVFKPAEDSAKRASDKIVSEGKRAGKGFAKGASEGPLTLAMKLKDLEARAKASAKGVETPFVKALGKMASEAKSKLGDVSKDFQRTASEAERHVKRMESVMHRAQLGIARAQGSGGSGGRPWGQQARSLVNRSVSRSLVLGGHAATTGALSFGGRIATDIARGAGLDIELSSHVRKNTELATAATNLSSAGYLPGVSGANGVRQDPKELAKEIRETATATGFGTETAAEGLRDFVGKTGDLALGRDIFKDLAKLSRATGTNLQDMVSAAGEVSNSMGDVPDKAEKVRAVMQGVAGQGKLGAVEIRDMADKMGKLASAAPQFEGDFKKNMAMMGALAQSARQKGGASSAAQAATSVMSFVSTFGKGARLGQFKKAGIDVYSKTDPGKIRSADSILIEALQKTSHGDVGADPTKLNKLFADIRAQNVTRGSANIYREAYNSKHGTAQEKMAEATKKVTEYLNGLAAASMAEGETAKAFAIAMKDPAIQMEVLNGKLQEQAQALQDAVIPALVEAAPAFLKLTGAVVGLAETILGITPEHKRIEGDVDFVAGASNVEKRALTSVNHGSMTDKDSDALDAAKKEAQKKLDAAKAAAAEHRNDGIFAGTNISLNGLYGTGIVGNVGQVAGNIAAGGAEQKNRETDVEILKTTLEGLTKAQDKRDAEMMKGTLSITETLKSGIRVSNLKDLKLIMPPVVEGRTGTKPK